MLYMRWFLHTIPYEKAENIFELVSEMKDILICIELRSLNDTKLVADRETNNPLLIRGIYQKTFR